MGTQMKSDPIPSYRALALQVTCRAINQTQSREEARSIIRASLQRLDQQVTVSKAFVGNDCRLVVLPEYFLTGFPMGETIPVWIEKACLKMDGPEFEALSQIAQKNAIYLSGNTYEVDPHFSSLYFQTSFIIDPSGKVILRYRRLNSMFAPTPHDVWDKYLELYGLEGVFPVVKTSIGNLAAIASEEILFPEIARCLVMRGAEIFLHSTSQANEIARAVKDAATLIRAVENMAYVISANSGGIIGTAVPSSSASGGSKIVDYQGIVLTETGGGESMASYAEIDLEALHRFRRRPGMENLLSRQRFEAYAESYQESHFYPANTLLQGTPDRDQFIKIQLETIERLSSSGIL